MEILYLKIETYLTLTARDLFN